MPDEDLHQPYDKLFKEGFSDPANAAALLPQHLPAEVSALIQLDQLQLIPGSFLEELTSSSPLSPSTPSAAPQKASSSSAPSKPNPSAASSTTPSRTTTSSPMSPAAFSTASSPASSIAPTHLTGPSSSAEFKVSATTMKDLLGQFAPTRVATEPQNPRRVFRPKEAFRPEAAERKRFCRLLYVYSDSRIPSCSPSDSLPKSKGVWNVWPK